MPPKKGRGKGRGNAKGKGSYSSWNDGSGWNDGADTMITNPYTAAAVKAKDNGTAGHAQTHGQKVAKANLGTNSLAG